MGLLRVYTEGLYCGIKLEKVAMTFLFASRNPLFASYKVRGLIFGANDLFLLPEAVELVFVLAVILCH